MTSAIMSSLRYRLMRVIGHERDYMDYREAKRLARDPDEGVRSRLAGRDDVQPEILYFLAEDSAPAVRRRIASNNATPAQADLLLSRDENDDVRNELATKIASLAPLLTPKQQERVGDVIAEILLTLAHDQLPRVRRILSEALKDATNVPASVIERLANDDDLSVARPVLEHSPLLSDEILLELIESPPVQGAVEAIARRDGLNDAMSDAIVATDDRDAITALLCNHSAQIREEALDGLVDRAAVNADWQAPLAARPQLSGNAINKLAEVVAESLLETLLARDDIDEATARQVSETMRRRLARGGADPGPQEDRDTAASAGERARMLHDADRLDGDVLLLALGRGDGPFVTAALALLASVTTELVEKIVSLGSAKGLTAIVWKAGLGMALCEQLQLRLSRIKPAAVLHATADGKFPLSPEDMVWQLDFFSA